MTKPVADLGGSLPARAHPPPHGQKFSQFHAVFLKIWQNFCVGAHWRVGVPSYEESWIRPANLHSKLCPMLKFWIKEKVVITNRVMPHVCACIYVKTLRMRSMTTNNGVFPKCFDRIQKKKYLSLKGLEPASSCVRDKDATTAPARYLN